MRKTFLLLLLAAAVTVPVFAELPKSITLESGDIRIRLDARKRWNVNRIEWKGNQLGTDLAGAHYGAVYRPKGGKHPIGTGHDESGIGEKLFTLKIYADGKEVVPSEGTVIKGKVIQVERTSQIAELSSKTRLVMENDLLWEMTRITAEKEVKVMHLYFFMHPWSPRFDKFHAVFPNGEKLDISFKADNSFPNRKFAPYAAWYETKTGLGAATFLRNIRGAKNPMRFIWDRKVYRKDYLCDFLNGTFPAFHVAVYESVTGFFQQPNPEQWIGEAETLMKKLADQDQ